MPSFLAEFQGGSFNPWGGPVGGCPGDIGPDFANLFYRWNIGQRLTAINLYMLFGGTNWGAIAAPVVATSYDYSSPISENRTIGAKYYETKLLTMFTRAAKDSQSPIWLGTERSIPPTRLSRHTLFRIQTLMVLSMSRFILLPLHPRTKHSKCMFKPPSVHSLYPDMEIPSG